MKVLFIEDNMLAAQFAEVLKKYGYEVLHAKHLMDADSLLSSNNDFCAAIVDLDLDKRLLPLNLKVHAQNQHAGWVYYKYVLSLIPPLDKNTIILSGFIAGLRNRLTDEEAESVTLIDKKASDCIMRVIEKINFMCAEQTDEPSAENGE